MKRSIFSAGACGFSLVELMMVLCMFVFVSGSSFALYRAQDRSYFRQQQVVEMQQNIRAFLFFIEKDIRMAGYNPTLQADAGITIAEPARVEFTADMGMRRDNAACNGNEGCDSMPDGEINQIACTNCVHERMLYYLRTNADGTRDVCVIFNDSNRATNGAQVVIDNVDGLEFLYHLSDGTTDTQYAGDYDRNRILSIDVSILARSRSTMQGYTNTITYKTASGEEWGPYNDHHQRDLVITNIKCRNMEYKDDYN